jgi:hypothetical protein
MDISLGERGNPYVSDIIGAAFTVHSDNVVNGLRRADELKCVGIARH